MGYIPDYMNADLVKLSDIPVWIAHSSDDSVVRIDSDDYCYGKLSGCRADVRYSRWDKFGHNMYKWFYIKSEWAEWMFLKKKG